MTNADKYLKDNVSVEELCTAILNSSANLYKDDMIEIKCFFKEEIKPTLTEDERVILRNINTNNYDKVGRKTSGALYLRITEKKEIDSTFEDFFQDSGLFQFIQERKRI